MTTFANLGVPDLLTRALAKQNITKPFPVQAATIPDALSGRDLSGKAPTGSGKTLAFGLPLLARVGRADHNRPAALILAPTRELAEQIRRELAPLAKAVGRTTAAVYGGMSYGPQKNALRRGVDVLVATPGRLEDLIQQRALELSRAEIVVVDEADRMADMGFLPAVRRILDQTARRRQTMLFSATLDGAIAVLSREYQRDPARHEAGNVDLDAGAVRHHFWLVSPHDRIHHTVTAVEHSGPSIVFTRTRHGADRVARQLTKSGVAAVALHGGRNQNQRSRALAAFASGKARALVATDVAARGIHIDAVAAVIHFDPAADAKDYVHRSGRTARAGATGTVVSLVTNDQRRAVRRMQQDLNLRVPIGDPELGTTDPLQPDRGEARTRPAPTTSIYVANLPWRATSAEVEALFARHGSVVETTIITDRRTGRSKGFGFVDMPGPAAHAAVAALHGSTFGGRNLTVRIARPRRLAG
jgi:superfamily II DNA/RNA helicase